jgi:methylated-DNA-[protein]-cysteine S-methyltransferase
MVRSVQDAAFMGRRAAIPPRRGYRLIETAIGTCGIAWSEQGVTRLQLAERDSRATERGLRRDSEIAAQPPPEVERLVVQLQRYCAGEPVAFESALLDLGGVSAFHRRIYDAARCIGWGHTVTYGELARLAGSPEAARAVGQALGRNPIPIIIPCHRILASGGKIGGFSAFGGARTKERLLALEGVAPGSEAPLLPGLLPTR